MIKYCSKTDLKNNSNSSKSGNKLSYKNKFYNNMHDKLIFIRPFHSFISIINPQVHLISLNNFLTSFTNELLTSIIDLNDSLPLLTTHQLQLSKLNFINKQKLLLKKIYLLLEYIDNIKLYYISETPENINKYKYTLDIQSISNIENIENTTTLNLAECVVEIYNEAIKFIIAKGDKNIDRLVIDKYLYEYVFNLYTYDNRESITYFYNNLLNINNFNLNNKNNNILLFNRNYPTLPLSKYLSPKLFNKSNSKKESNNKRLKLDINNKYIKLFNYLLKIYLEKECYILYNNLYNKNNIEIKKGKLIFKGYLTIYLTLNIYNIINLKNINFDNILNNNIYKLNILCIKFKNENILCDYNLNKNNITLKKIVELDYNFMISHLFYKLKHLDLISKYLNKKIMHNNIHITKLKNNKSNILVYNRNTIELFIKHYIKYFNNNFTNFIINIENKEFILDCINKNINIPDIKYIEIFFKINDNINKLNDIYNYIDNINIKYKKYNNVININDCIIIESKEKNKILITESDIYYLLQNKLENINKNIFNKDYIYKIDNLLKKEYDIINIIDLLFLLYKFIEYYLKYYSMIKNIIYVDKNRIILNNKININLKNIDKLISINSIEYISNNKKIYFNTENKNNIKYIRNFFRYIDLLEDKNIEILEYNKNLENELLINDFISQNDCVKDYINNIYLHKIIKYYIYDRYNSIYNDIKNFYRIRIFKYIFYVSEDRVIALNILLNNILDNILNEINMYINISDYIESIHLLIDVNLIPNFNNINYFIYNNNNITLLENNYINNIKDNLNNKNKDSQNLSNFSLVDKKRNKKINASYCKFLKNEMLKQRFIDIVKYFSDKNKIKISGNVVMDREYEVYNIKNDIKIKYSLMLNNNYKFIVGIENNVDNYNKNDINFEWRKEYLTFLFYIECDMEYIYANF